MADVRISYTAPGWGEVLDQLEARGRRLREFTPGVADELVAAVLEKFEDEGPGWPELAPSTLANRRGGGGGAKILQDTSAFVGSWQAESDERTAAAVSNTPYGRFHVTGTRNMPQRDPTDLDFDAVAEAVEDFILSELVK